MNNAKEETSECPSPETLKKYLEGALRRINDEAVEDHLMQCEPCLQRLIEISPKPATPEEQAEENALIEKTWRWFEREVLDKHNFPSQ